MPKKRGSKKLVSMHDVWNCPACNAQFMGGPRCHEGNPLPEEREAEPGRYTRMQFMKSLKAATLAERAQN